MVESRTADLVSEYKWFIAVIIYCTLVCLFIPDDPTNPITRYVAGVPYVLAYSALLVILPPVFIFSLLDGRRFTRTSWWHRSLVLVSAFVAWVTFAFTRLLPLTAARTRDDNPNFSGMWALLTFIGMTILVLAMVSGKAPQLTVVAPASSERLGALKAEASPSTHRRRISVLEIIGILAGIATVAGVVWTILRDLTGK